MPVTSASVAHAVPHSRRSSAGVPGPLAVIAKRAVVITSGNSYPLFWPQSPFGPCTLRIATVIVPVSRDCATGGATPATSSAPPAVSAAPAAVAWCLPG
jgi:hypothetical protein